MNNLDEVVSSAEKVVSSASTARSVANPSIAGPMLTQEHKDSIRNWIRRTPGIPEDEDPFERGLPDNDITPLSPMSDGPLDGIFSDTAAETTATSTQYDPTKSRKDAVEEMVEETDFDVETRLIEHFQKLGKERYSQRKFLEAEGLLRKSIETAEKKFGVDVNYDYRGREVTVECLAMTYLNQEKFGDVEALLDKYDTQFKGRKKMVDLIMTTHLKSGDWEKAEAVLMKYTPTDETDKALQHLAVTCCQQGEWDYAEKLLNKHTDFTGREAVLEQIAMSCYEKEKWDEADMFLREFLKDKDSEESIRVYDAAHSLADVCLQKHCLEDAEKFCRRAMEGRKRMFGGRHAFFHRSVYLLVEICYAKEDTFMAEGFSQFLPPNFQRTLLKRRTNCRMP